VAGTLPLHDVTVTVRPVGTDVRAEPDAAGDKIGTLSDGDQWGALALLFGDYTWLSVPWPQRDSAAGGWIAGESTDFSRSAAYDQVAVAWYESDAVLGFRRALARDVLKVRGADPAQAARVDTLSGDNLRRLEEQLTRQAVPPGYVEFWQMQDRLGLPDPFDYLPVHTAPPAGIDSLEFAGFGPTLFAFENWPIFYDNTRGMANGVDFFVPEGSPLIAVADGVIVDFPFLANPADKSLALRPYLPDKYRKPDGSRVLSNVLVGYGYLTGDPTVQIVRAGDEVQAGQIIGTSGWPLYTRDDGSVEIQAANAHLHLEVHLVTDGQQDLGSHQPFNPLLFWTPRLIALQARLAMHSGRPPYPSGGEPFGRLGFFSIGCFRYAPPTVIWAYEPSREAIWPPGVYDLTGMIALLQTFAPYPLDGSSAF
jgi:murein DD-endopeptidase MepM/ murein hydrolase activator NlpD